VSGLPGRVDLPGDAVGLVEGMANPTPIDPVWLLELDSEAIAELMSWQVVHQSSAAGQGDGRLGGNQSCSTPRFAADLHQDDSAACHAYDTDRLASDRRGDRDDRDREDEVGTLDPLGPLTVREG